MSFGDLSEQRRCLFPQCQTGLTGTGHGIWNKRLISKCCLIRQNYLPQGVNIMLPWVTFVEEVGKQNCNKIKEIREC